MKHLNTFKYIVKGCKNRKDQEQTEFGFLAEDCDFKKIYTVTNLGVFFI